MMKSSIARMTVLAGLAIFSIAAVPPAYSAGSEDDDDSRVVAAEKAIAKKDYKLAINLLKPVVSANLKNAGAWNLLGFSLRKTGQMDKALTAYKKALEIDPKHLGANEYLGELYVETGRLALAREQLKKLDSLCTFGCGEYDDLKKAIEAKGSS